VKPSTLDEVSARGIGQRVLIARLYGPGLKARTAIASAPADNIKVKINPPSSIMKTPAGAPPRYYNANLLTSLRQLSGGQRKAPRRFTRLGKVFT
jgi:hypothetical protein